MTGNTHAGNALRYVKNNVLSRARKSASKVLIVLTDGVSEDEIEKAASDLKLEFELEIQLTKMNSKKLPDCRNMFSRRPITMLLQELFIEK